MSKPVAGAVLLVLLAGGAARVDADTERQIIRVGPDRKITTPSEAAKIAKDGAIIEIDAGVYPRDAAIWRQNDLTLRGVGGHAHLRSEGQTAQGKAIWVIKGDNTRVENIEFSGARVEDRNGAGIRQEGLGLTVTGCSFHDNENGILSGNLHDGDIVIEHSEFARNGSGDGRTHNIYIGHARSFTLRHSYVHHAKAGHGVKSRAAVNYILYNRIMDEAAGNSSYAIDLPEAGDALVMGNLIQQGPLAENSSLISYARKSGPQTGRLFFVSNSIVNDRDGGYFIRNNSSQVAFVANNIFAGRGKVLLGKGMLTGNLFAGAESSQRAGNRVATRAGFVDRSGYDYRLSKGSDAIDAASDAAGDLRSAPFPLRPDSEYVHPAKGRPRRAVGTLDIGAYEFTDR